MNSSESPEHARVCSRAKLSDQSVVPIGIGLIDKSFRPHAYDRNRHLVTKKGVSVEAPIELIHLRQVEFHLVQYLATDGVVQIPQRNSRQLAMGYGQGTRFRVHAFAKLESDCIRDDTIAWRGNQSLALHEMGENLSKAGFASYEICIEKEEVGVRDGRTEIDQASMQRVGQRHPIFVFA